MRQYATHEEIFDVVARSGGCIPSDCAGRDCTCRMQAKAMEEMFRVGRRAPEREKSPTTIYTAEELSLLIEMVGDGSRISDIAAKIGRSRRATYAKIRRLEAGGKLSIPVKERSLELTQRQKEALDAIKAFWAEHGYAPSYDIIARNIGAKSKSSVFRLIKSLEDGGYITKRSYRARSVRPVSQGS